MKKRERGREHLFMFCFVWQLACHSEKNKIKIIMVVPKFKDMDEKLYSSSFIVIAFFFFLFFRNKEEIWEKEK